MTESSGQAVLERETTAEQAPQAPGEWVTVVLNDPVNLMSFVSYVFMSYFGYSRAKAERLMMQVHQSGRATVARGTREKMERDTLAMHEYGLWAQCLPAGSGGNGGASDSGADSGPGAGSGPGPHAGEGR